MSHDESPPDPAREQALERAAAALRDDGLANGTAVPDHVRRATLQALWVAEAAAHETVSRRRNSTMRIGIRFAAVVAVVCCGLVVAVLARKARKQYLLDRELVRVGSPLQITTTGPAATQVTVRPGRSAQTLDVNTRHAVVPVAPGAGSVWGRAVLAGAAPEPEVIDLGAVKECALQHPDGLLDESIVVGGSGGLANVVVSLNVEEGVIPPAPPSRTPAVMDQKGCRYVPHVLAVMVGQPVVVKNSDPFLHNVHALSIDNPAFNFGQPNVDPGRNIGAMRVPERFKIKCDVHPWMYAYVNVFGHPYFAVSGADGTFAIPGHLPDGTYTATAWHERLGELQAHVVVTGGKAAPVEFRYVLAE